MGNVLALRNRHIAIRPPDVGAASDQVVMAPALDQGGMLSTERLRALADIAVSEPFGVEALQLKRPRRGRRRLAAARQYAMALVHMGIGRSQEDVADAYRRNRTTASHHMEMVEWLNEIPEHEFFWNLLVERYQLLIGLALQQDMRRAWLDVLAGIDRALDDGILEGDAVDQASYIHGVFWEDRIRA